MTLLLVWNRHGPHSAILHWPGRIAYRAHLFTHRLPKEDNDPRWYGFASGRWHFGRLTQRVT